MIPGIRPNLVGFGREKSVSYVTSFSSTDTGAGSFTMGSLDLSGEQGNVLVGAVLSWGRSSGISGDPSMTVGGTAMTMLGSSGTSGALATRAFWGLIPGAASRSVVLTFSTQYHSAQQVSFFILRGMNSSTPKSSGGLKSGSGTTLTCTGFSTASDDVAILVGTATNSATFTWTSPISEVVENTTMGQSMGYVAAKLEKSALSNPVLTASTSSEKSASWIIWN